MKPTSITEDQAQRIRNAFVEACAAEFKGAETNLAEFALLLSYICGEYALKIEVQHGEAPAKEFVWLISKAITEYKTLSKKVLVH